MQAISIGFFDEKHILSSFIFSMVEKTTGIDIYFNARNERSLFEALRKKIPDVLMMNLTPNINMSYSLIKKIKSEFPGVKPVGFVYGIGLSQQEIFRMINSGIASILTDAHSPDEFFASVQSVAEKGFHLNDVVNEAMITYCKRSHLLRKSFGPEKSFTEREIKIIEEKRTGKTSREIADQLFVSKKTVDGILQDMYNRYDCKNFNELSRKYDCRLPDGKESS